MESKAQALETDCRLC